jgi:radical SAM superfamily enzyme YgiQ (UPF0313 family)
MDDLFELTKLANEFHKKTGGEILTPCFYNNKHGFIFFYFVMPENEREKNMWTVANFAMCYFPYEYAIQITFKKNSNILGKVLLKPLESLN